MKMIKIWCWIVGHDWKQMASYSVSWYGDTIKKYSCTYKECNRCGESNKPEVSFEIDEEW